MSTPIFNSDISEQRWNNQLNDHFAIYVDNPPSIFHIPKAIIDQKPEAYTPQQIGIGAYHHFRVENSKLAAVKKFLKPDQYANFKSLIVDKVRDLDPQIRSCYSNYLDLDGDTLAWIMSIDGVYLLNLLSSYSEKLVTDDDNRTLARDIIMVENQIPCLLAQEINKALRLSSKNDDDLEEAKAEKDAELLSGMLSFCKAHTPLDLTTDPNFVSDIRSPHLLHYMHTLIVKNWSTGETNKGDLLDQNTGERGKNRPYSLSNMQILMMEIWSSRNKIEKHLDGVVGEATQVTKVVADLTGRRTFRLLANLPLQQFADMFMKNNDDANSFTDQEIQIPSATEIQDFCKIEFRAWTDSGIGIKYDEKNCILYLPVIRVNTDSEVILRNLVAYEEVSGSSSNVVSGYVDFMCGIIDTAKDVDLLKEKGIIKSVLPREEIAKIFNGMRRSTRMRADLEETVEELKRIDDNTLNVKAWRFVKDHFVPSKTVVKFFLSSLMVLMLTLQAFCQFYGCRSSSRLEHGMMISSI
ncbi:OLC1v1008115C1 [Oldenlandia corymbosa var. corymbosa]|uniref:OLC1v1008115C1 n=1 Tax=Oldenlandia corymbosa var. corymbosa TaxID=529605 RepID=A0AAV1DKV2_OLDCO|nr:OLC1v1008115C1 [Oldenlandia corymbosa var. corymbosa]